MKRENRESGDPGNTPPRRKVVSYSAPHHTLGYNERAAALYVYRAPGRSRDVTCKCVGYFAPLEHKEARRPLQCGCAPRGGSCHQISLGLHEIRLKAGRWIWWISVWLPMKSLCRGCAGRGFGARRGYGSRSNGWCARHGVRYNYVNAGRGAVGKCRWVCARGGTSGFMRESLCMLGEWYLLGVKIVLWRRCKHDGGYWFVVFCVCIMRIGHSKITETTFFCVSNVI